MEFRKIDNLKFSCVYTTSWFLWRALRCLVNQLRVMSSILRCRDFTNPIYLVPGDRRRINFPVNVRRTMQHDSFAVSAMKERGVVLGHLPYAFFQSCTNSAFFQTFSSNSHSLCNPVLTIAYFPTEVFLTSYKFVGVAVC